jgi:hypothetical protein
MNKNAPLFALLTALALNLWLATAADAAPNYALSLDGSSGYVDTGAPVIPANGDFSVEAWINCTSAGAYTEILSQGDSGNAFYIGADSSSHLRIGETWPSTGVAFPVGGWHHLAVVKSSTNTIFFLDGTNLISKGSAITNPSGSSSLRLGRQFGAYGEYWPGAMDDVRIWSRALSAAEIQTNRLQRPTGTEPGLLAAWEFDEGSGTNCASLGSFALTNPITGSPNWVPSGVPWPAADNALFFNGAGAYLDAGAALIPASGDFTVACWAFCPRNVSGFREIISQGTLYNAFYLGKAANGNVRMGDGWWDTGVAFPLDSWHQFTLVKTSTNAIFYLDGTNRLSKGSTLPNPVATSLRLGRQYGANEEYWPGAMDDVRIWNRALSAAEVQAGFNRKPSGSEPGLLAAWEFDEGMGTAIAAIATNLVLTGTNGATWMMTGAPQLPNGAAGAVTGPGCTNATLNGVMASANFFTTAWFDWGATTNYENHTPAQSLAITNVNQAVSSLLTGLTPNQTYHFRLVLTNLMGMTVCADQSFLTPGPSTAATSLPARVGCRSAALRGVVNPDGFATQAWFEWGATAQYGNRTEEIRLPATNASLVMSAALTGLTPGQTCHFRLVATNSAGVGASDDLSFRTPFAGAVTLQLNGPNPLTNAWHASFTDPGVTTSASPVAMAAASADNLVLKADGTVAAWGYNFYRQSNIPATATNVIAVDGGNAHNVVLRADGSVIVWGNNVCGQLNIPATVTNVIAISAGGAHSLALRADGSVVAWGYNNQGQSDVPVTTTTIVAISAGGTHSLALKLDASVVAWGLNSYSQASVPATATNVVAIAAGDAHNLALKADGTVVAWGYNEYSQANVPDTATNIVAVAAGGDHSLALKADGTVVAWGYNADGENDVPAAATNVVAIAAGGYHSLALRADGRMVGWGFNAYGETDVPASVYSPKLPLSVSGLADTNTPGAYQLTYSYTNAFGQAAATQRTVVIAQAVVSPPVLTNLSLANGKVSFTLSGDSGQTVVVEACTNLAVPLWVPVQTNTLGGSPVSFNAPVQLQQPSRFFRLRTP